jgi:uncharacterized protein (TIGR02270 family)
MPLHPFQDVVEESLDEAVFLWRRWRQELASPTRNLREIYSWTEDRLHGALDGVRVASPAMLESLLSGALQADNPIALTVAAHVLVTAQTPSSRELLCDSVRQATGPKLAALMSGFELAALDGGFAPIAATLTKTSPEHRAALCRLKSFRRATLGQELVDAYESNIPALQSVALRAAAFLSHERTGVWIKAGLEHEQADVRLAAIITGIRHRDSGAWNAATQLVQMNHAESATLLNYVAMFGSAAEHQLILTAVDHPELNKRATRALGAIGTRDAIDRCIGVMRNEALTRLAGEAYCAITGVDLERDNLALPEPDAPSPSFEDDDLNANLVPSDDATRPLPNVAAIENHWASIQSQYAPGARYVRGRPRTTQTLIELVETGPMLRRPEWIFEAAVRTQGQFDIEPNAFAQRQHIMMRESRARIGSLQ